MELKFWEQQLQMQYYQGLKQTRHLSDCADVQTAFAVKDMAYLRHIMRKPTFFICENKDADQLRGNSEADHRLCFHYTDSTIPLLPKSEISSL